MWIKNSGIVTKINDDDGSTEVGIDIFTEYFIFSPSIRGVFGIGDELVHYDGPGGPGEFTNNIDSIKNRAILLNFTFH